MSPLCYGFRLIGAYTPLTRPLSSRPAPSPLTVRAERVAAEAANSAKKQFMRYLFHELRVPLNAVLLGVEDLYETYGGE